MPKKLISVIKPKIPYLGNKWRGRTGLWAERIRRGKEGKREEKNKKRTKEKDEMPRAKQPGSCQSARKGVSKKVGHTDGKKDKRL